LLRSLLLLLLLLLGCVRSCLLSLHKGAALHSKQTDNHQQHK
jgi:hypothetical protein